MKTEEQLKEEYRKVLKGFRDPKNKKDEEYLTAVSHYMMGLNFALDLGEELVDIDKYLNLTSNKDMETKEEWD